MNQNPYAPPTAIDPAPAARMAPEGSGNSDSRSEPAENRPVRSSALLDRTHPSRDRNETYTAWNWPVMIVGSLVLILIVVAPFLPAQ